MASEAALVQDYISEDWARVALKLPALPTCSYCAISVLDQLFYLSAMYLVSRQTLPGEKTLVAFSDQDKIT